MTYGHRTTWRLLLCGAGNVGGGFLRMLSARHADLATSYGVDLRMCGVAEYGGCAVDPGGLDLGSLINALDAGMRLGDLDVTGRPGMTAGEMISQTEAELVLEATPLNLVDGEPGISSLRTALDRGMHVVMANKGPLALAYHEFAARTDVTGGWARPRFPGAGPRPPRLRFSATVAGALPVVNIGRRDLAGDRIERVEAVFNGTSQSIVRAMENGATFADALEDARRRGIAEADPSLDIDGHDAACKLVITANSILGCSARLSDVATEGIRNISPEQIAAAAASGRRIVPLSRAEIEGDSYRLEVRPVPLTLEHPLARLHPEEMGVVFCTGQVNRLSGASLEPGPEPAAGAMLRDVLDIIWSENQ